MWQCAHLIYLACLAKKYVDYLIDQNEIKSWKFWEFCIRIYLFFYDYVKYYKNVS